MAGSHPPDRQLVERILKGEVRAFEELVALQEKRVFRVLSLMGVRSSDLEDLAQEVFLRIFKYLKSFKKNASLDSWIYKIAVHTAIDARKKPSAMLEIQGIEAPDGVEGGAIPADETASARQLLQALSSLSPRERAVFVLSELEGIPNREIGKILRVTQVTVRRHLSRARTRLEELYREN